jgi:predicted nucleic acid-binding protein
VRTVFADTHYWIATINPKDQWNQRAIEVSQTLPPVRLVTTDDVLAEVLNFFSGQGELMRSNAARAVRSVLDNAEVQVVTVDLAAFLAGLELYDSRPDKAYSLTDCVSMELMRSLRIREVLTHDRHFEQEGFQILL